MADVTADTGDGGTVLPSSVVVLDDGQYGLVDHSLVARRPDGTRGEVVEVLGLTAVHTDALYRLGQERVDALVPAPLPPVSIGDWYPTMDDYARYCKVYADATSTQGSVEATTVAGVMCNLMKQQHEIERRPFVDPPS